MIFDRVGEFEQILVAFKYIYTFKHTVNGCVYEFGQFGAFWHLWVSMGSFKFSFCSTENCKENDTYRKDRRDKNFQWKIISNVSLIICLD